VNNAAIPNMIQAHRYVETRKTPRLHICLLLSKVTGNKKPQQIELGYFLTAFPASAV
jgi:hypothetical protein